MNIILEGIVGSHAYGMATPESDEDRLGIFMAPLSQVVGLHWNNNKETIVHSAPDKTYHELGKFCRLALKANPTITELLWLPEYTVRSFVGRELIQLRDKFLSTHYVQDAYRGYSKQQVKKLVERQSSFSSSTKNRTAKHGRHCIRLLYQGMELLATGNLTVKLGASVSDYCREMGELAASNVKKFVEEWESLDGVFRDVVKDSVLPEKADMASINDFLVKTRMNQAGEQS